MSGEEKPIFPQEAQRLLLERAKALLKEAVDFASELVAQVNILGVTEEEKLLTLRAFDGLTPEQLREASLQYKERQSLHKFLDEGIVQPDGRREG